MFNKAILIGRLTADPELWIEDDGFCCQVETAKRVGIGYAAQEDQDRLWRFVLKT